MSTEEPKRYIAFPDLGSSPEERALGVKIIDERMCPSPLEEKTMKPTLRKGSSKKKAQLSDDIQI